MSKYALKTDLDALTNRTQVLEDKVNNLPSITPVEGKDYQITNVEVTGNTLTITQNNMGSKSVELPTNSGGGSTSDEVESIKEKIDNAKTLVVTKNGNPYKSYNPFTSAQDITIDIVGNGDSSGDEASKYYQAFF